MKLRRDKSYEASQRLLKMRYTVYVLKSVKHPDKYYVGITRDLQSRLQDHNNRLSGYTKRYAPWDVETYVVFKNKKLAEDFEKYLKEGSGQAFLTKRFLPPIAIVQAKKDEPLRSSG